MVSLWRPHYYREDGEDLGTLSVRMDIKGEVCEIPGAVDDTNSGRHFDPQTAYQNQAKCLDLALSDFATDELCEGLDSATLSIRYVRLAELVDRAEQLQRVREERMGVRSQKKLLKRKRTSSPAEEIGSEDESRFQQKVSKNVDLRLKQQLVAIRITPSTH